ISYFGLPTCWNSETLFGVYRCRQFETYGSIWVRIAGKSTYNGGCAMSAMAGATTVGDLAGAIGVRTQEAAVVAELKAGSEEAYAWLIGEFHQPIYSLVYRIVTDPADAADTTQEGFLKG